MQNIFPITLVDAYMLSPKVKHFVFCSELEPAFQFTAGQFITIHFEHGDKTLKRSYSLANAPTQDNTLEFAAGYVEGGPGTELLFNLSVGQRLNITGPFGRLTLKDVDPKRYILAATSTGVTPYRSMMSELGRRLTLNPELSVVILLGVQTEADALYALEFEKFAAEYPGRIALRVQLSRAVADAKLATHYHRGYVQQAFAELNLNPLDDLVYLCGNPSMIDEAFEDLKARGFAQPQIIREKYLSAR